MVKEIKVVFECKPDKLKFNTIPVCSYQKKLADKVSDSNITKKMCMELLEQMFMIRAIEEMLAEIVAGIYKPLPDFRYVGPTHLSISKEATSAGAISVLEL